MNTKYLKWGGIGAALFLLTRKGDVKVNVNNNNIATANSEAKSIDKTITIKKNIPRGIRNNNAGNIKRTSEKWQGMSAVQTDPVFINFDAPIWGIRAIAKVLRNYERKHNIDNVHDLVKRWSATDQSAYSRNMARALGVGEREKIKISDNLTTIINCIIKQENGYNPYDQNMIAQAITMA